jgi:hypothetical protein
VKEALLNHAWVSDIQGGLPVGVLVDYLQLWDILVNFRLQPGIEDRIDTSGTSQPLVNILLRRFMRVSSWGQLLLGLERKIENLGLLPSAPSLCGLLPIIAAGLQIAWHVQVSLVGIVSNIAY